jgi:hypothetical protein
MLGKKLIYNRGVMIAFAVVALMTLTAGVAAAASAKAKFEATGIVGSVGLAPGGTVESDFKIAKDGSIKHIEIHTVGEAVGGVVTSVDPCEENGKHSTGACDAVDAALLGSTVISVHESSAKLKVVAGPFPNPALGSFAESISGTLKGRLKAEMATESADTTQLLTGTGNLKVRSTEGTVSTYGCLLVLYMATPPDPNSIVPIFGPISKCIDNPGPNPLTISVDPSFESPVMVPVDLHVTDTGMFEVSDESIAIKGKLKVVVDSTLGGTTTGTIEITKGKAKITHDHGDDDDDDDDDD